MVQDEIQQFNWCYETGEQKIIYVVNRLLLSVLFFFVIKFIPK